MGGKVVIHLAINLAVSGRRDRVSIGSPSRVWEFLKK